MLIIIQILNAILIFVAGVLLATRIYPSLFESSQVTGHDYVKDLQTITRKLSERRIEDPDLEYLKTEVTRSLSLIAESLLDSRFVASDTRTRTRVGLLLLAAGTFIQSLLFVFTG